MCRGKQPQDYTCVDCSIYKIENNGHTKTIIYSKIDVLLAAFRPVRFKKIFNYAWTIWYHAFKVRNSDMHASPIPYTPAVPNLARIVSGSLNIIFTNFK